MAKPEHSNVLTSGALESWEAGLGVSSSPPPRVTHRVDLRTPNPSPQSVPGPPLLGFALLTMLPLALSQELFIHSTSKHALLPKLKRKRIHSSLRLFSAYIFLQVYNVPGTRCQESVKCYGKNQTG